MSQVNAEYMHFFTYTIKYMLQDTAVSTHKSTQNE